MTDFNKLYQDYGEYNVLYNQLNLPSHSVEYSWRKTKKLIQDKVEDIIQQSRKKTLSIADVGCGNGGLIIRLAEQNRHLATKVKWTGYDLSRPFVDFSRQASKAKQLKNIFFEILNIETGNLPDKYDVIICSEVLEHLHQPQEILKKIYHSLNEGGYLILTTPNSNNLIKYPFHFLKQIISQKDTAEIAKGLTENEQRFKIAETEQHLFVFSQSSLRKTLSQVGFSEITSRRSSTLFGGPFLDNHPWLLGLTLIFDSIVDLLPIASLGWDNIFYCRKK